MTDDKKDRRKSIRLPGAKDSSGNNDFTGRSDELKKIKNAFAEQDARAVALYGDPGIGKTALAVKFAEACPDEFEYAYSFDCRGGISAEEVIYRLCQFMDYHGIGSFQNILLSHVPINLKIDLIVKVFQKLKALIIFDEIDSLLEPEHGRLTVRDNTLGSLISQILSQCETGTRFLFTSSTKAEIAEGHVYHLNLGPLTEGAKPPIVTKLSGWIKENSGNVPETNNTDELISSAITLLSDDARAALMQGAAFEKAIPASAITASADASAELTESGLAGRFIAGGETMLTMHTLVREHIRASVSREQWKSLILSAAEYREKYARDNGIIWHMIYAHELYVEAMRFDKAAEIADLVTPTLLGWGQTHLAKKISSVTAESASGPLKAKALYTLGCIEMGDSNYDQALELLDEAQGLFEHQKDRRGYSDTLTQTASIHKNRGNLPEAIETFERALTIKEELDDSNGIAAILNKLGRIYQDGGEAEKAIDVFRRSAEMASKTSNSNSELMSLESLGELHSSRGNVAEAIEAFERELELLKVQKEPNALTRAFNRIGGLYLKNGDGNKALRSFQDSLKYAEVIRNKELAAINMLDISRVYLEARDYKLSIRHAMISLALFDTASPDSKAAASEVLAHIEREIGPDEFKRLNTEVINELQQKEKSQ